MAKLVPGTNGSPSKWVSYIVTTVQPERPRRPAAAPSRPSTDNTGTLVDNGDGTYTYTFYRDITRSRTRSTAMTVTGANNKADLGDLTYEPTLVHRLTIQLSGNAPGTGTNTPNGVPFNSYPAAVPMAKPVDAIYDFVPATGSPRPTRAATSSPPPSATNATASSAASPGTTRRAPAPASTAAAATTRVTASSATPSSASTAAPKRRSTRPRSTFTSSTDLVDGRAVGNLPNHIHKIHMGEFLAKKNYNYGGVLYNETRFPQDIRNCTKCHDGSDTSTAKTAQGDNWKNVPNRLACGACHDGIDFATGKGVTIADAQRALTQHAPASTALRTAASAGRRLAVRACHTRPHRPRPPPGDAAEPEKLAAPGGNANSNTNAAWIASNLNRLPAGAIKVTLRHQERLAQRQQAAGDGVPHAAERRARDLQRLQRRRRSTPPEPARQEMWAGFMGSPSVYFVFSVPQDGIAAPADFNASVPATCAASGTARPPAPAPAR